MTALWSDREETGTWADAAGGLTGIGGDDDGDGDGGGDGDDDGDGNHLKIILIHTLGARSPPPKKKSFSVSDLMCKRIPAKSSQACTKWANSASCNDLRQK